MTYLDPKQPTFDMPMSQARIWAFSSASHQQQSPTERSADFVLGGTHQSLPPRASSTIGPKAMVGGALVILGLLIVISFFALPWMGFDTSEMSDAARDFTEDSDFAEENGIEPNDMAGIVTVLGNLDGCTYTGLQVALRRNGSSECEDDESSSDDEYEPRFVEVIERSVAIMPFLGGFIVIIGIMIAASKSTVTDLLIFALILAIALVLFPIIWAQAYSSQIRDYAEHIIAPDGNLDDLDEVEREPLEFLIDLLVHIFASGYQTLLHTIIPVVILLTVVVGFIVIELADVPRVQGIPE